MTSWFRIRALAVSLFGLVVKTKSTRALSNDWRNNVSVALLASMLLCSWSVDAATRAELVSAYIYRLMEHIGWSNESDISSYHIHVIDTNRELSATLKKLATRANLHGKALSVSRGENTSIPQNTDIIYLSSELSHYYPELFTAIQNKNILIISHNVKKDRLVMINLLDTKTGQISFSINKANLINQQFKIDPDIILLGGTEIDVAKLYWEGEERFQQATEELMILEKSIETIKNEKIVLIRSIEARQIEVNRLRVSTVAQEKKLQEQKQNIKKTMSDLQQQETVLEQQNRAIEIHVVDIARQGEELNSKKIEIENRARVLESQQLEIEAQFEKIGVQRNLIVRQEEEISDQKVDLGKRSKTIASQKNYLVFMALFVSFVSLLAVIIYNGLRLRKQINRQLTQQKEVLELTAIELEHAKDQAELANTAKSIFLANMSHELRTPLNSVLGFTDLMMRDSSASEKQRRNLDIISRSGKHLLSMINDVLDLSKIESGKVGVKVETIDLRQTIQDVADMIRVRADNQGIGFDVDLDDGIPRFVKLDGHKLRQVLINLLGNAVKFTSEGEVILRVSCRNDQDQDKLIFIIKDTGCGIPIELQENIFEPFFQANSRMYRQVGTGLGLAISRQISRIMNGDITVQSKAGSGSIFRFFVLAEKVNPDFELSKISSRHVIRLQSKQQAWRVLIVEDQIENRLLLSRLLLSAGFEVREAVNGVEALVVFKEWQPHLIWMDLRMPIMDGNEATRHIRKLNGGEAVKIIAITASAFQEKNSQVDAADYDGTVYKPYASSEIFKLIAKNIDVKFLYDDDTADVSESVDVFVDRDISCLPSDIIADLRCAARELDQTKVLHVLESIRVRHPEKFSGLSVMAKGFRFDKILGLCEKANGENAELFDD